MIDVFNIRAGWATLAIGENTFCVSYLSNLKSEIDALLNLESPYEVGNAYLEGEHQGDLHLVAYLIGDELTIIWQRVFCEEQKNITIMRFPFKEFKDKWKRLCLEMEREYIENFLCPLDDEDRRNAIIEYKER